MKLRNLLAAVMIVSSSAAPAQWASGGTVTVTNVVLDTDQVYLEGSGMENPHRCAVGTRVILGTTPAVRDRYLSVVMTALAAGLKIDIWVQGCGDTPWGTAEIAYFLNLHR
jgi:hypothetical protein